MRIDVAAQAGALAQKAGPQGGIVSDQGDELIEAREQLVQDRVSGRGSEVRLRPQLSS